MWAPPSRLIHSSCLQALDVTKRCNTSCSSHSTSQQHCAGSFRVTPTVFCFIWVFVMDISSLLLVLPQTTSEHSWDSSAPVAVVISSHPGGWAIKDRPLRISHSLQGNNQNLGVYRDMDGHEPNHQRHSGWIICLWLVRARSHSTTTLVFPNDSGC